MESYQLSMAKKSLHGARPATLKVKKDSYKIKKPIAEQPTRHRPPVIIYTVSPKVIHTNPNDFMSLVQRLTGASSSSSSSSSSDASVLLISSPPVRSREEEAFVELDLGRFRLDNGGSEDVSSIPCCLPLKEVGDFNFLHGGGSDDMLSNSIKPSTCVYWEVFHQ